MSKKQLLFLALALAVGSLAGFFLHDLLVASNTSAIYGARTVSKTITITQFSCSSSNYDADIGNFCVVDKTSLSKQPVSMNCMATATFTSGSGYTLSEKCDPNGTLIGNPFFVAWKSGYLELLVEDGTYNFNPPRVVTYSAAV